MFDLKETDFDLHTELGMPECTYVNLDEADYPAQKTTDLSVIHLNVRGLLNKQDRIKDLLINCPSDIIMFCETWLTNTSEQLIKLENYKYYGRSRMDKIGGGVGIAIKDDLRSRIRLDLTINTEILEHIIVELKTDNKNILLVSGYRPPNGNTKKYLTEYKTLIQSLTKLKGHEIIIGMDHNLDFLKCNKHSPTSEFLELNLKKNLLPCISKPTRVTTKSATLIDNIFISSKLQQEIESSIIISDISDHFPLRIQLRNQKKCNKEPLKITSRKMTPTIVQQINDDLAKLDWDIELHNKDANEGFITFHNHLTSIIHKYAPEKTRTISRKKLKRDPWITSGIQISLNKQKRLYIKMLRDKTDASIQNYKNYRNTLQSIMRRSKNKYIYDKCEEYKQDSRKLWQLVNRLIGKERNKKNVIEKLKVGNEIKQDPTSITDTFNNFFSTVGEKYASKIPYDREKQRGYQKQMTPNTHTLFFQPCTPTEIWDLINNLPNKGSSGHDNISNIMLKSLGPSILHPLSQLFNKSLEEGIFPDMMKLADVTPLYKSKDPTESTNYRPISLLMTLSKQLEKIVHKRTYDFLESTNQLYYSQYGFRKGHSCEHAVSELISEVIKAKQEGFYTVALFLDLSKAFDTLDHKLLLEKMEIYGIRGVANAWFKNYLTGRKMRVKCSIASTGKVEYSNYNELQYGTLQGSCLGPLLFTIFTNDLHKHLEHCKSILFADDTTIYKSHRNLKYLSWCLEQDLNILYQWFSNNKLTLNIQKKQSAYCSKKQETDNQSIYH